ncbi:MAG: LysM peptidoglycan-binding domain-containing protein [Desulfobacteraceae bacterium]|jgi:hypothetical protein
MVKKGFIVLAFSVLISFLMNPSFIGAQPLTHTVVKGDTLWDLCEKYYGDPDLWPKLWEMNPFVTNPHLLKPGDVITLLEIEPLKKPKPPLKPVPEISKPVLPVMKGVDVSTFTDVRALGYLSPFKVKPLGYIRSSDSARMLMFKGDTAFVDFGEREDIKVGDEYDIAKSSPLLKHPLTELNLGYAIAVHGRLVIKERLKKPYYRAEIVESFIDISVGDMVIPYEPISPCIQPVSTAQRLYGNIVATKNQSKVLGQHSVVYLDSGFNDGIQRGYVFEAIRVTKVPSLDLKTATWEEIKDSIVKNLPKEQYLVGLWKRLTEGKAIYETPVGKIMVVETRPYTATAIVLSSVEELSNGAFIQGTSWLETPDYLADMPSCTIE